MGISMQAPASGLTEHRARVERRREELVLQRRLVKAALSRYQVWLGKIDTQLIDLGDTLEGGPHEGV